MSHSLLGKTLDEYIDASDKSTLDAQGFAQAGRSFESLSSEVFKVIFAYQLKNAVQRRAIVAEWEKQRMLPATALPDLVILLDNSAIIRGRALRCLDEGEPLGDTLPDALYKYGDYTKDKWLPLALLVFELAQRSNGASWSRYLMPHLPAPSTLSRLLATEE